MTKQNLFNCLLVLFLSWFSYQNYIENRDIKFSLRGVLRTLELQRILNKYTSESAERVKIDQWSLMDEMRALQLNQKISRDPKRTTGKTGL